MQLNPPPLRFFKIDEVQNAMHLLKDGQMKGRGIIKFD